MTDIKIANVLLQCCGSLIRIWIWILVRLLSHEVEFLHDKYNKVGTGNRIQNIEISRDWDPQHWLFVLNLRLAHGYRLNLRFTE
jgi:hypothetical protein